MVFPYMELIKWFSAYTNIFYAHIFQLNYFYGLPNLWEPSNKFEKNAISYTRIRRLSWEIVGLYEGDKLIKIETQPPQADK